MSDIQKEREEFKAWVIENLADGRSMSWEDWCWKSWQAAKAKAQAVPEWIDVSDRLPEEGEEVFVHHYGHIVQATRDKKYSGGFKQRNCYGWESVSCYVSHWMPMSVKLPESVHFYYEHDAKVAKEKAMIEAQEPENE